MSEEIKLTASAKPQKRKRQRQCEHCGKYDHPSFRCWDLKKKLIRYKGKGAWNWEETKKQWLMHNPPDADGAWYCYIGGGKMDLEHLTLDHVKPRGSNVSARYSLNNLKPCCGRHNRVKGSRSLEKFLASNPSFACGN